MQITADQCRAARSLLNWTQDQLATKAAVSRATITDFESSTRQPMKNNLRSIADCIFAAGVDLIPEDGDLGVGVRFNQRKVTYVKHVRIDRSRHVAIIPMRFAGREFSCVISFEAVNDYYSNREDFSTDDEFSEAISDIFDRVYAVAERCAPTGISNGELKITWAMLASK